MLIAGALWRPPTTSSAAGPERLVTSLNSNELHVELSKGRPAMPGNCLYVICAFILSLVAVEGATAQAPTIPSDVQAIFDKGEVRSIAHAPRWTSFQANTV